jgi:SAM-dependent methyltransferase
LNPTARGASVGEYANSMFRFDFLNQRWIASCARYLRELFGARLDNAVALDYGFGRGNWAVALLWAGARKVIAIDASEDNCRRLFDWLASERITGIEVVHGNVLEVPISRRAEIIWAHGILHHVEHPAHLLRALRDMVSGPDALLHVYAYDRGSLRQTIIETVRRVACYTREEAFRSDAPLFAQRARLRVRDDLTAPVIHWLSMAELDAIAQDLDLSVVRRHADYSEWLRGSIDEEFQPHNLLLSPSATAPRPVPPAEPARPHSGDVQLIAALSAPLFDLRHVHAEQAHRHAIGLCSTHFEALADGGGIAKALHQDLLQVLYLLYAGGLVSAVADAPARQLLALADAALSGRERAAMEVGAPSRLLVPYLKSHAIRL